MDTATIILDIIFGIFGLAGSGVMITFIVTTILDQRREKAKHNREMQYYEDRDARDKEYHEKLMDGLK